MKKEIKPIFVSKDAGHAWREVDFFLRLHRHLPDKNCGGIAFGDCYYRQDGKAINAQNDYVDKLQQDPEFVKKEKEVEEAVKNDKKLFNPPIR